MGLSDNGDTLVKGDIAHRTHRHHAIHLGHPVDRSQGLELGVRGVGEVLQLAQLVVGLCPAANIVIAEQAESLVENIHGLVLLQRMLDLHCGSFQKGKHHVQILHFGGVRADRGSFVLDGFVNRPVPSSLRARLRAGGSDLDATVGLTQCFESRILVTSKLGYAAHFCRLIRELIFLFCKALGPADLN